MKRQLYILIFLGLTSLKVYSQDPQGYWGRIYFQIVLPGNPMNYSISSNIRSYFNLDSPERKFDSLLEIKSDTACFNFWTAAGLDTLHIILNNLTDKTEMRITVTNLVMDYKYLIDLTTFTPGRYVFDWSKICRCQDNNPTTRLIECDGKKLYQLEFENKLDDSTNYKIKPFDISEFKDK